MIRASHAGQLRLLENPAERRALVTSRHLCSVVRLPHPEELRAGVPENFRVNRIGQLHLAKVCYVVKGERR